MQILSKLKKLVKRPHLFLRDYLLKRHPLILSEFPCELSHEGILIENELKLYQGMAADFPVDVVITWVNSADDQWRLKFNQALTQHRGIPLNPLALNEARFECHGELALCVQSILSYLPWVSSIYIVTDDQCSEEIQGMSQKIKFIDHTTIIPSECLPTFNSHVIEAFLHKIPDLSEHFIYFNDDVFVARPLPINHFFEANGLASLFLSKKNIFEMEAKGVCTPTLTACLNVNQAFFSRHGKTLSTPLTHTYVPLKKSMYEQVWVDYKDEILDFVSNKFRGAADLNLATFLVPWVMYHRGASCLKIDVCHYFNGRSKKRNLYKTVAKQRKSHALDLPHSFCINDTYKDNASSDIELDDWRDLILPN